MNSEVLVYADWDGLGGPRLMGTLRPIESRGKELFSFAYDEGWLTAAPSSPLDPDLKFFGGAQYLADDERPNFGLFLDSSPDRWGRLLMRRREAALARKEGRAARRLGEPDYLLGVHDEQRLGAMSGWFSFAIAAASRVNCSANSGFTEFIVTALMATSRPAKRGRHRHGFIR